MSGEELKERVREASDIVEVVNGYVPLKRAGANFVALCPFHQEKTPSFHVNPAKQIFYCFGCRKGGDVFAFVQEYEKLSFPEALRRLAERAKIPVSGDSSFGSQGRGRYKETLYKIHEELASRWHRLLRSDARGREGRQYIKSRGIGKDAAIAFRLGFAPGEWDDVLRWGKERGYGADLLEKAGLVCRKENTGRRYDRFRRRLMFPITDVQGRVIGFSGRLVDSADSAVAKYVNSPETAIFKKGKVLYGLDKARTAALEAKLMIVCEGQLDVIACHANGIQNVVSPQGTALTADHARILKRYVSEAILCFDSDNAGQNAVRRSANDLLGFGLEGLAAITRSLVFGQRSTNDPLRFGLAVRMAVLPSPHDPDSFLREKGAAAFQKIIEQAPGYFDYLLESLCRAHDAQSDRGRNEIVRSMGLAVNQTGNAVTIDNYVQKTSLRLGVSAEAVRSEFSKVVSRPAREIKAKEEAIPQVDRPMADEFWLLKIILGDMDPTLAEWIFQHLDMEWVQHPVVKQALLFRWDCLLEDRPFEVGRLLDAVQDTAATNWISEAAMADELRKVSHPQRLLADILLRLRNDAIQRQVQQIGIALGNPQLEEKKQNDLCVELQELQKMKRQPLQPLADA